MSLSVDIQKQLGDFRLQVRFEAGNEILALLGASGCGKSVTLKCVSGVLTPDEGRIVLDGTVLYDSAAHINLPPQKRHIGYLFQQYALFPNMTVRQNIAVAVPDKSSRGSETEALLKRFQLESIADRRPRQISGGQQQRTALARILASRPQAILLDEPFSALDGYLKYQLELEMQAFLADFPGTVLWVSHDRGEVWRNCPRVCLVHQGRSQPPVPMKALFQDPGTESAARLSGCKNYAAARPVGTAVVLPEWGLRLECGRPVPAEICKVGIRSHHILPADDTSVNRFSCQVVRVIDDVFGTIVLLRPAAAAPDAPLLRMELGKDQWAALADPSVLSVSVAPEHILLLRKEDV